MGNKQDLGIAKISLPKGGGAISYIGETFQPNTFTGTASLSIPIHTTPCRGFEPHLSIDYSSGAGNGVFGLGFGVAIPNISRKTDKCYPEYSDADTFLISNADDLVPKLLKNDAGEWKPVKRIDSENNYVITEFRPRTEGLFAKIEKWDKTDNSKHVDTHWRVITKDNVMSIYGKNTASRIADSSKKDVPRVFKWLLQETTDAKGNRISYEYQSDRESSQSDTTDASKEASVNKYIYKIKYGHYVDHTGRDQWHFELVFDYRNLALGESTQLATADQLAYDQIGDWDKRKDSFSWYRCGFEIRTNRLCHRVLLFHRFSNDLPFLVHATHLEYAEASSLTLLKKVTEVGYRQEKPSAPVLSKAMPALQLKYSKQTASASFQPMLLRSNQGKKIALSQRIDHMVDLFGDGLPGILHSDDQVTLYSRPLGKGEYAAPLEPAQFPIDRNLDGGQFTLSDLGGDGKLDLIVHTPSSNGYFQSKPDNAQDSWSAFNPFKTYPTDGSNQSQHMMDVTGDGLADLVIYDANKVKIYPSLGKQGFASAITSSTKAGLPLSKQKSSVEFIDFVDLIGDGGNHLVRIRNGSVECWPHIGYGQFANKVVFKNAPRFDGQLDPARLFLADIDGSGTTDLIYAKHDRLDIYRNESGNAFADKEKFLLPQGYDSLDNIRFSDVLGNGTSCLILTSRNDDLSLRHNYYDFNAAGKPHLLNKIDNNRGTQKKIHYAASTKFYLDDLQSGRPWTTRLSFPVQVVESVDVIDKVACSKLITRYAYHDGYFDPDEREFRGFAYVEQWDAETPQAHKSWIDEHTTSALSAFPISMDKDSSSYVAPIYKRSWYHMGARNKEAVQFNHYHHQGQLGDDKSFGHYYAGDSASGDLPDSYFDDVALFEGAKEETLAETYRALFGHKIRQETYTWNNKLKKSAGHPLAVTESNFRIRLLQPLADQTNAVCFVHPCEEISWHYEGDSKDPRVEHSFTLKVDDYGHVVKSCHVNYPRRKIADNNHPQSDMAAQFEPKAIATVHRFSKPINTPEDYLLGVLCEEKSFELIFNKEEFIHGSLLKRNTVTDRLAPEDPETARANPRLLTWARHFFWDKELSAGVLPLCDNEDHLTEDPYHIAPQELHHHSEIAVFSNDTVSDVFAGKVDEVILNEAKYISKDDYWWNQSVTQYYQHKPNEHYLATKIVDPFGHETMVSYDDFDLMLVATKDALGNETKSDIDYYNMQPMRVTDINNNTSEVIFDPLGQVVITAIYGTEDGVPKGDTALWRKVDFDKDDDPRTRFELNIKPNPDVNFELILDYPEDYLLQASSYYFYEHGFIKDIPPHDISLLREKHVSNLKKDEVSKIQIHINYHDGFGRNLQSMSKSFQENEKGGLLKRWLTSGRTVYNNKGKPVKQYEPFYVISDVPEYVRDPEITGQGVTHITHYDALLRVVKVSNPDGTFTKVEFTPWQQKHFDENDNKGYSLRLLSDNEWLENDDDCKSLVLIKNTAESIHLRMFNAEDDLIADQAEDDLSSENADKLIKLKALLNDSLVNSTSNKHINSIVEAATELVGFPQKNTHFFNTPDISHLDAQGRVFQTIQLLDDQTPLVSHHEMDVVGNELSATDARGICCFKHRYDMTGDVLWTNSHDAGERWSLHDVMGSPLHVWDSRDFHLSTKYDSLHRPIEIHVEGGDTKDTMSNHIVEKMEYGGSLQENNSNDQQQNCCGKMVKHYDQAGLLSFDGYDIKGDCVKSTRRLCKDYKGEADWREGTEDDLLEPENLKHKTVFVSQWQHDALGRLISETYPDGSISSPQYHPEGWLKQLELSYIDDPDTPIPFVKNISYDPKGQRDKVEYANGATTSYGYDKKTFHLLHLKTTTGQGESKKTLQDLHYTYDPVGNVTSVQDEAQQTTYFNGEVVSADAIYNYDAIYRLQNAMGREHIGQVTGAASAWNDKFREHLPHPNDGQAMRNYSEAFEYDEVGNILKLSHTANNATRTRHYHYSKENNQLLNTQLGSKKPEPYQYDSHGNIRKMPHLNIMQWDFKDHLRMTQRLENPEVTGKISSIEETDSQHDEALAIAGDKKQQSLKKKNAGPYDQTWYVYDASGERMRKVTETCDAEGNLLSRKEFIYLGAVDIYREYSQADDSIKLERESLHVMDDKQRIVLLERQTKGKAKSKEPNKIMRYQLGNNLGSVSLELDKDARIISYEEYTAFGSTSYQAVRKDVGTPKRYRYSGKERDDGTGLYYYGARYYASWLGRWMSPDPAGAIDGLNLYAFVEANPTTYVDHKGYAKDKITNNSYQLSLRGTEKDRNARMDCAKEQSGKVRKKAAPTASKVAKAAGYVGTAGDAAALVTRAGAVVGVLGNGVSAAAHHKVVKETANLSGMRPAPPTARRNQINGRTLLNQAAHEQAKVNRNQAATSTVGSAVTLVLPGATGAGFAAKSVARAATGQNEHENQIDRLHLMYAHSTHGQQAFNQSGQPLKPESPSPEVKIGDDGIDNYGRTHEDRLKGQGYVQHRQHQLSQHGKQISKLHDKIHGRQ